MKKLKISQKLIAVAFSFAAAVQCSVLPASALDTGAANTYCSKFAGEAAVVPHAYSGADIFGYNPYYTAYAHPVDTNGKYTGANPDCTNFVSQVLYYAGMAQAVAHLRYGVVPGTGLHAYLSSTLDCRMNSGLTFSELIGLTGNNAVKAGDVIQLSDGSINYGHSMYVNHVVVVNGKVVDILYSAHTNDCFYQSLSSKCKGNSNYKFTVFHTSDF